MLTTIVHDHADRVRSYELVASDVIPALSLLTERTTSA
jgi:hypothetical protein